MLDGNGNGAAGAAPSTEVPDWRKRLGAASPLRHDEGYVWLANPDPIARVGRSRRSRQQGAPPRKLSQERATDLCRLARGRSLRDLAAEFGVSHETVRQALRQCAAWRVPQPAA